MKYCGKCGNQIVDESVVCPCCGDRIEDSCPNSVAAKGSLPAFILGLIGSIFGLFGGLCVFACLGIVGKGAISLPLMVGGSVIGLIGACKCLKDAKKGSIMQFIAAAMIFICGIAFTGADAMSIIGMIVLTIGGIVGFVTSKI